LLRHNTVTPTRSGAHAARFDLERASPLLQRSPELINIPDHLDQRREPADLSSADSDHHDHACPVCDLGVLRVIVELMPQPTGTPTLRTPPAA
jgi:hypothetical protein